MVFVEGYVYRITCVGDGSVLDVPHANTTSGTDLITHPSNGGNNQKCVSRKTDRGWYLATFLESNEVKVLDQDSTSGRVQLWGWGNVVNQQWNAVPVSSGSNVFTIVNASNAKAITSHGKGKKVTCENQDITSAWQHWIIQQI